MSTQDLATGSGASGPALRATTSVLLSAPEYTTPLVAAAPTFGLELPLRFVIWLDDKNVTQVGYVDVGVLAARHGLKADDARSREAGGRVRPHRQDRRGVTGW